jgi:hypothetical protein
MVRNLIKQEMNIKGYKDRRPSSKVELKLKKLLKDSNKDYELIIKKNK